MSQQVDVPGMGMVEFPDNMGDDEIATAIKRNLSMSKVPVNTELTWAEKNIAPLLPDFLQGNLRGSAVGRVMQGAADPGVGIAQLAANAISPLLPKENTLSSLVTGKDNSLASRVNQSIADTEAKYQAARADAGSTGFDPLRLAGNVAITAPAAIGGASGTLLGMAGKGALTGAAFSAAEPITNGGQNYWLDKLKQVGLGAAVGGVTAPLVGALAKAVSPAASTNPQVQLLQREGVKPTIGQAAGGVVNNLEEKAQSLPIVGSMIQNARQGAGKQLEDAAYARAADPIGATISERGNAGISELYGKLGAEYEKVIPKLSVNTLDPAFVGRMANLRSLAQSLPAEEARQFDNILKREIDNRIAPNGVLSGQNLKDAWMALRDTGNKLSKSPDAYQSQLGQAVKQSFQELKDHVAATNPADVVSQLRNTDLGYANFKRLQSAAASTGADSGSFTPAQLQSAVRKLDTSKDKARFAEGDALMQDLSSAGKSVLSNKVPDSGTAGRALLGLLMGGSTVAAPHVAIPAMAGLGVAYTPAVQNALVMLLTKRPEMAPQVANYLQQLAGPASVGAAALSQQ